MFTLADDGMHVETMITATLRRLLPASMVVALLAGVTCGGEGPAAPRPSVFGAVGASVTRLAIQGYNEIGGSRAWPDEPLAVYDGAGVELWAQQIGQSGSPLWNTFRNRLQADPGTDQIWWHLLPLLRGGPTPNTLSPADQQLVRRVGNEIRRLVGPSVPIYVSPFFDYEPSTNCTEIGQIQIAVSKLMAQYAIQQGLAEPGPELRPLTGSNNNAPGDPCHQGPVGRQQHGQDLRDFFGG